MPHLGLKSTFAIKLAFLAKGMAQQQYDVFFRPRRSKNDFLDQEKWPKGWKPICHSQAKWYHYDCS